MVSAKETNGWYRWVVVFAAFIVYFIIGGVLYSFGVLLVDILEEFDEPVSYSAGLSGIFLGFSAISSPCAGSFSDAFGRRPVLLVGATVFSCGLFASTFAPSIIWLYFTYGALGGMGYGLMGTVPIPSVMEHFKGKKGLATGIAFCGTGVGTFVMSHVTSYLLDAFGLRGTFLVLSGIMLHGFPCGLIFRKPVDSSDAKDTAPLDKHSKEMSVMSMEQKMKHIFIDILLKENAAIFRDLRCLPFLMSSLFFGLSFFVPFSFLPEQAVEMGIEKYTAAWLTSAMGICSTLGRICIGWLGNRSFVSLSFLLKFILLMTAISLPVSLLLTSFETKLVFACCYGFLFGGYVVTTPLALAEQVPIEKVGKTMGLFVSMITGANLVGAPIVGWTIDITGDYKVCYIVAGSVTFMAFIILMLPQLRGMCRRNGTAYKTETTHL